MTGHRFATEADLCAAFLTCVPKDWQAYPETCGFDIVLVHKATGIQIGVEAKLTLNAKVLCQIVDGRSRSDRGPDFRAVLVGKSVAENAVLARHLGVKILSLRKLESDQWRRRGDERVEWEVGHDWLPRIKKYDAAKDWFFGSDWIDEAPVVRLRLPEYVPEVAAGVPAPIKLTDWTIQAIKICVLVSRIGAISRAHFAALRVSPTRWCDGVWMERAVQRGFWKPAARFPSDRFRAMHPSVFAQIEADWPKWSVVLEKIEGPADQGAIL